MDIERDNFWMHLPSVLKSIAESHAIAIDLELSGIPVHNKADRSDVRQSLEERYQELRGAAQTYHILQVGLTCIFEDSENKRYILRTYNFNLSPLVYDGLDVERKFTYSTGAVEFLLSHGYQMDSPFVKGVPYLSKSETDVARKRALQQWNRRSLPDIKLNKDDVKASKFVKRVKREILNWTKTRSRHSEFLNISGERAPLPHDEDNRTQLTGFERRLVHQVVRSDFPDLQTYGKSGFVQVQQKDRKREAREEKEVKRRVIQAVCRQQGFRWVADALAGNDLSDIELSCIVADEDDDSSNGKMLTSEHLAELCSKLRNRQKVIVGHNCFMDLVYFYQHFYGGLPETLAEFQDTVSQTFDLVIDTKYIATSGPHAAAYRTSQLWQIEESLANSLDPLIEVSLGFQTYDSHNRYHEAGYDSLITAKVFLKLGKMIKIDEGAGLTTRKSHERPANVEAQSKGTSPSKIAEKRSNTKTKMSSSKTGATNAKSTGGSNANHTNIFNILSEADEESSPQAAETPASSSDAVGPLPSSQDAAAATSFTIRPKSVVKTRPSSPSLLSAWDSPLWKTYGNRIRVYGTIEETCELWCGTQKAHEKKEEEQENQDESVGDKPASLGYSSLLNMLAIKTGVAKWQQAT